MGRNSIFNLRKLYYIPDGSRARPVVVRQNGRPAGAAGSPSPNHYILYFDNKFRKLNIRIHSVKREKPATGILHRRKSRVVAVDWHFQP